jgi:hypothetical protein
MLWGKPKKIAVTYDDSGRLFLIPERNLDKLQRQRYALLSVFTAHAHQNYQEILAEANRSGDVYRVWHKLSPKDIIKADPLGNGSGVTEKEHLRMLSQFNDEVVAVVEPLRIATSHLVELAKRFNKEKTMADALRKAYERSA